LLERRNTLPAAQFNIPFKATRKINDLATKFTDAIKQHHFFTRANKEMVPV